MLFRSGHGGAGGWEDDGEEDDGNDGNDDGNDVLLVLVLVVVEGGNHVGLPCVRSGLRVRTMDDQGSPVALVR